MIFCLGNINEVDVDSMDYERFRFDLMSWWFQLDISDLALDPQAQQVLIYTVMYQ